MAGLDIHGIRGPSFNIPQVQLDKFKKLGGIQQRIYQFIKSLFASSSPLDTKMATQFSAEHLTQGALGGHYHHLVLRHINKKIFHKQGQNYEKLKRNLEFAEQVANKVEVENTDPQKIAAFVKDKMRKLKPGESLTVPCGYRAANVGHGTALQVERQQDGRYLVRLHNEGEGLDYHYVDPQRCKYQTALEIAYVTEENLCDSPFFDQLFSLIKSGEKNSITKLYEHILPLLNGVLLPPSSDDRLWSRGQLGGSCPVRSMQSVIRSTLNEEEYKQLKIEVKTDFLFKIYREIKYRRGNTEINRIVALEIVKNLKHQLGELPTELAIVEEELKRLHGTSPKEIAQVKLIKDFDLFLDQVPTDSAEILHTFKEFKNAFKDEKDMPREDVFFLSYRAARMWEELDNLKSLSLEQERQKSEILSFCYDILFHYKRAHIATYYPANHPLIQKIDHYASQLALPTSAKLEKMKELMPLPAGMDYPK